MGWVVKTYRRGPKEDVWTAGNQVVPYPDEAEARHAARSKILPHLRHYDSDADMFFWYQSDGISRTGYRAEQNEPYMPPGSLATIPRSLLI